MTSLALPRPDAMATRIARLLRPAAEAAGAWVSTEAAVQLTGRPLLRPAVVVVRGEPPYDGVATRPPLLVVEFDPAKVARWAGVRGTTVWARCGDDAIEIRGRTRRVRRRGEHLTVPNRSEFTLPVGELLRGPAVANVIQLPR